MNAASLAWNASSNLPDAADVKLENIMFRTVNEDNIKEWDYWYEGKETSVALKGTDGNVSVKPGEFRDGGSYVKRFSNIAVWNSVMDNYDYSLDKWYEFLNS